MSIIHGHGRKFKPGRRASDEKERPLSATHHAPKGGLSACTLPGHFKGDEACEHGGICIGTFLLPAKGDACLCGPILLLSALNVT